MPGPTTMMLKFIFVVTSRNKKNTTLGTNKQTKCSFCHQDFKKHKSATKTSKQNTVPGPTTMMLKFIFVVASGNQIITLSSTNSLQLYFYFRFFVLMDLHKTADES